MNMKSISLAGAALVLVAIVALSVNNMVSGQDATVDDNIVADQPEGIQEATLRFLDYEYIMEPTTLQQGVPAKITVDLDTVYGCMRDVVIPAFGVRQYVSAGDNVITFTPDKSGTFDIVCSMNMGRGTFSVSGDGSGNATTSVPVQASGSTSGSSSTSCGIDPSGAGCAEADKEAVQQKPANIGSGSCGGGSGGCGCGAR
ncbi:MAG: hypothetical protein ABIC95_05655 [archaeon]